VDLGGGRLGGDVRCGVGDGRKGVSASAGAYWFPWHGVRGVAQVQAGFAAGGGPTWGKASFRAVLSTGLAASRWEHRIALVDWEFSTDPFTGPPTPAVDVGQTELSWISTAAYAIDFVMLGFELDVPVAAGAPSYTCVDCEMPMAFDDFAPGWRLGVFAAIVMP
jgi:hypothetical protein